MPASFHYQLIEMADNLASIEITIACTTNNNVMNHEVARKLLAGLQKDAEARIEQTQRHIKHAQGPVSQDFAEQATERENDDVVYHLNEQAKRELNLVKRALARIEKGEYGQCAVCSSQIDDARLAALPYADLCKMCAEQQ